MSGRNPGRELLETTFSAAVNTTAGQFQVLWNHIASGSISIIRSRDSRPGRRPDRLDLRAAHLQRLIRQHFPPDKDAAILDVGCGHGAILSFARQAGYHNTVGIDWSAPQVAEAARRGITGIIEIDVLQVLESLAAESQDVVIAFDVIEHFTKDELLFCLDQIWRVLKTGAS